jgi:hypothetical protein
VRLEPRLSYAANVTAGANFRNLELCECGLKFDDHPISVGSIGLRACVAGNSGTSKQAVTPMLPNFKTHSE